MKNITIVHRIKTNIIAQNGNINIGSTLQNSHTSNFKMAGASFAFGDFSKVIECNNQTKVIEVNKGQTGSETE
ncbi:spore germination protein [Bacillus sp. FJAT-27445]|uniref:spore germination protein n=1 Tax=Bacillus sp. FJAT-27445 TaxID=1679166 RepID=UPI0007439472|nr:spore germination protein [Bacillus sp. FJAT-27445]